MDKKLTGLNCGTIEQEDFLSKQLGIEAYALNSVEQRVIKVQFHIIRQTNGSGGVSSSQVDQALTILRNGLKSASICVVEKERSYIDNNTYYLGDPETYFASIVNTNRQSDAINIYLLPTTHM